MRVGLIVTTDDDDTLDAVMDFLENVGKGDLKILLENHDPLATVMVDTSEGDVIWC